jgi:enterobacterial common antigen flippase
MTSATTPTETQVAVNLEAAEREPQKNTYGQILKSSVLIGGSQAANIGIGIIRTKAMALLLGPAGYGLFGIFGTIANMAQSIAGMGVSSSGVRQIAVAVGSGDSERIAQTTTVLRRTSIVLGLLGSVMLLALSRQVSAWTFGNTDQAQVTAIRVLSLAVFIQVVSWGQDALIQGMRRIADLAKVQVLSALFGMLVSIPLVYVLRQSGVVPSLIVVALMSLVFSWWYSRKIRIRNTWMAAGDILQEAGALIKLGLAFMATGFMTMGIAYAVRILLLRQVGFAATGYYQSAWTLGGMYVSFILQAMAADFYPRLTASAHDNAVCNRLVNEQARVGLLLAGPGALATLTFAPLVISLFYSAKFGAATDVLRWICLGATLQVITWPLGFIIIAKGKQGVYFTVQLAWTVASVVLAYMCIGAWGLKGAGIAFFASYIVFGFLVYPVVYHLSGFTWSKVNIQTGLVFLSLIALVFCGFYVLPLLGAGVLGTLTALITGVYSMRVLVTFVSRDKLPAPLRYLADLGQRVGGSRSQLGAGSL